MNANRHLNFGLFVPVGVVFLFVFVLVCLTEAPSIRYHERYRSHYVEIYEREEPIDVVFAGSSRANRGFYISRLQEDLSRFYGGREPVLVKLAIAGQGTDAQTRLLLDLLEHRKVNLIFFQIDKAREKRRSKPTHRNLKKIGRLGDILFTPLPRMNFFERVTHRTELMYMRIAEMLDDCVSRFSYCTPHREHDSLVIHPRSTQMSELLRVVKKMKRDRGGDYFSGPLRKWSYKEKENFRTHYYINRLLEAARKHDTKVVLVDIPKFGWTQLDPGFVDAVKKEYGVDYLYLSKEVLLELGLGGGYGDHGHVNLKGEPFVRRLIVEYFMENYREQEAL